MSSGLTAAEAIRQLEDDHWIRPESWRGLGQALTIQGGLLLIVPSARGGRYWHPYADELCEQWEIVLPKTVCDELTERNARWEEEGNG